MRTQNYIKSKTFAIHFSCVPKEKKRQGLLKQ